MKKGETQELEKILKLRVLCTLYANKYENLNEMGNFLEKHNLPKLNLVKTVSLNGLINIGKKGKIIEELSPCKSIKPKMHLSSSCNPNTNQTILEHKK